MCFNSVETGSLGLFQFDLAIVRIYINHAADGAVQFRDDVYRIDYRHNWAWQQRDREAARGLGSPP